MAQTTIRMQSSRIAALQVELDRALKLSSEREVEAQELRQENKQLNEKLSKLQKSTASGVKELETLKTHSSTAEAKVKDLGGELAELGKDRAQMEVQLRRSEADSTAKDTRLNRLMEENEKNKLLLREAGHQSKDQEKTDRREVERLQGEVRKIERQRAELVGAFKKQMRLIEVLKRQRAHMEAAKVLSFTEEEFIRVLELGDRLGEK